MANIAIKEGGSARRFTVRKLKTDQQGGGSVFWVPKSAVALTTKSVSENGKYAAAADGYYGYSQLYVNCSLEADSVVGKGEDGKTYEVSKDSSGNIVKTLVD